MLWQHLRSVLMAKPPWDRVLKTSDYYISRHGNWQLSVSIAKGRFESGAAQRTPSWLKPSTWKSRTVKPAVLSDATANPNATDDLPATPVRCVQHSRELQGACHTACEVISAVTQSYAFREQVAVEGDSLDRMVQWRQILSHCSFLSRRAECPGRLALVGCCANSGVVVLRTIELTGTWPLKASIYIAQ